MLCRRVSSVPVLASYYLYRCTATACVNKTQLSHYSTGSQPISTKDKDREKDKEGKDKQKQQPPKAKDIPKAAPSTAPTPPKASTSKTSAPAPLKVPASTPTTSLKTTNPNLPSPHTASVYENIHPVYEYSKSQEDRVLGIEDLVGHVTKNAYKNDQFKDTEKVGNMGKVAGSLKEKKFSLYGVFDGHQGKFAAEYVKERLPYELVAASEFAVGDYEAAIKKAYASVQKALLASGAYVPEQPKYDFTAGTTASIALVTPTTTYLAQLGNTPILAKRNDKKYPSTVFTQQPEDVERLRTSNMFLMVNYAPVSDAKDKREFWKEITEQKDGVSNINTLGSLGDSLYEPANINRYLEAMRAYLDAEAKRKAEEPKRRVKNPSDLSHVYKGFVKFVRGSDAWKAIEQHVAVSDDRDNTSWITNGLVEVPEKVQACSLRREPQVTAISNADLQYVNIVTDGVLLKKFEEDPRAMKDIDRIARRDAGKARTIMGTNFSDWFFGNYNDDLSSVIITYQK